MTGHELPLRSKRVRRPTLKKSELDKAKKGATKSKPKNDEKR